MIEHVALIGIGKVGTALSQALSRVEGIELTIVGRDVTTLLPLADELSIEATTDLSSLDSVDLFILCVPDDVIKTLSQKVFDLHPKAKQAHVSGSRHYDELAVDKESAGIFYPLDSFGYAYDDEMMDTPILIDAGSDEFKEELSDLAYEISDLVYELPYEQRLQSHMAAVWLNNFGNALAHKANLLLQSVGAPEEILKKLTQTTFYKIQELGAAESQTGPAVRGDENTLSKHMKLLNEEDRELYLKLTKLIQENLKSK